MARDFEALAAFLAERGPIPFAWGRNANDCVGFALAGAQALTGVDLLPGVSWSTELGAARVIHRLGGLEQAIDARLSRVAPALAMRGDWAAVADVRFGISLRIIDGATLVSPGGSGLRHEPRAAMIAAWNVEVPK